MRIHFDEKNRWIAVYQLKTEPHLITLFVCYASSPERDGPFWGLEFEFAQQLWVPFFFLILKKNRILYLDAIL